MGIFDFKKVKKGLTLDDGSQVFYEQHIYERNEINRHLNLTDYFVIKCPKPLQRALIGRFHSCVDVCNDTHLASTNEDVMKDLAEEIKKGEEVLKKYHKGQNVYSLSYDKDYNLAIVFIYETIFIERNVTYMVNHTTKVVSPVHGFNRGREYAKKMNYTFKENY